MNYPQDYEVKCEICGEVVFTSSEHDICQKCEKKLKDPESSALVDYIIEQKARIKKLEEYMESIEALCDEEIEWQSVEYGYLPIMYSNIYHIREAAHAALRQE